MSNSKFLLVSLPSSAFKSNGSDDAIQVIQSVVSADYGTAYPFAVTSFKIGTLDALVEQADDLARLSASCEGVVNRVGESLQTLLDGDEGKVAQQKVINDRPVDQYLRSFHWNKVKYRADKSIAEFIDSLSGELSNLDSNVKAKFQQHSVVKANLTSALKRQTGNLSTKSLASVVPPSALIPAKDSEHLESHLIAVPNSLEKEFLNSYETLVDTSTDTDKSATWVVPGCAQFIAADSEYTLYSVATFKKASLAFIHKCKEKRWIPREFKYVQGGKDAEMKEVEALRKDEKKLWGEALRLGKTAYGGSAIVWVHVLVLRVFVETVLRYGLPLDFVCGIIQTTPKHAKKVKANLDQAYAHDLAGNAFGKDKKGRVTKDDSAMLADLQAVGQSADYSAYVYFDFEIV